MTKDHAVPRTMSTQHPDNVSVPSWSDSDVIEGETELHEAFFAYSKLGCNEVMWDSEGKDVDSSVVRKLLSKYPEYFEDATLGREVFLTYRIPNPRIEVPEKKIVTETLQTIPRSADVASTFYKRRVIPVSEVILPLTTNGNELVMLHNYYRKAIVGAEDLRLVGPTKVKDWIGSFAPKSISVIPLIEDSESLVSVDKIVWHYLRRIRVRRLRVFIARSDPALNYGLFSAVLLSKVALSKLKMVERKSGVSVHPIIGVGSMPFRGHLSPDNVRAFLNEYKGLSTVTVQSAFRYDHAIEKVRAAIEVLNSNLPNGEALEVSPHDERILRGLVSKVSAAYQSRVEQLAPLINSVAAFVPPRRARKLHIGLFGYGRNVKNIKMPRAIPFAAALYSMGAPPEFIGAEALESLDEQEWDVLEKFYVNLRHDLSVAGDYVSWESVNMLMDACSTAAKRPGLQSQRLRLSLQRLVSDLSTAERLLAVKLGPRDNTCKRHMNFVNNFVISYIDGADDEAKAAFLQAARLRRCLG